MKFFLHVMACAVAWGWLMIPECVIAQVGNEAKDKLRVLIVDGHNPYHDWQVTTPLMKRILEDSGRFAVDVATSPPDGADMSGYRPRFADYDVVLGNYNGQRWPRETERDFEAFVAGGGGYVCVHAANNAFPEWEAYNRMVGLGGWGGRNEKWGPYLYFDDEQKLVRDDSPGVGGSHGSQHEYQVRVRDNEHPITRGLPAVWMHAKDELYDRLRGPAEDLHILATAYSSPEHKGTGRHEPMLMTLQYGNGRVFHTALGHADYSMKCVGFITTLLRGTEWAATGDATIGIPDDFPTADEARSRK